MSAEAFQSWLDSLVADNRLFPHERDRLMASRELYDMNRLAVEADLPGRVVGFVDDRRLVANSAKELLNLTSPEDRPIYFEYVPGVGLQGPTAPEERERLVH
ncbi:MULTISPECIES: hypothetical protein [Mycobacteriaceae]|uniref:Uncharacterized protein n=1 Tax=Mycolicibacterium mucogenicum DSM 44124 TaxID=1226753 RepID=A0A8H2JBT0_MYCMU|nr:MULTISPECIES: hypothetical protein [Mycobacteriaceae]KAB7754269.1 hypothetical protein MMUC44124_23360 [Mycolicibacterium mucogenicum DSM 44124]QPG70924.1 hypothetical protein C1S78_008255 [Mycolicibacterium mucogenicum DSM 44124]SEB05546.1 hypothetical protein SAMN04488580_106283 [Mycobacterium sp. 283mftsu]